MSQGRLTRLRSRTACFLVLLYLLLAAAAWLVLPMLLHPNLLAAGFMAAADDRSRGAVLIVAQTRSELVSYGLLRRVLSHTGYGSLSWLLPNAVAEGSAGYEEAVRSDLEKALADVSRAAGCSVKDVWVIAQTGMASRLLTALDPSQAGGMVLLATQKWPEGLLLQRSEWSRSGQLLILAPESADQAANRFYESITGEDATLFPAGQNQSFGSGRMLQSVDGRVSLLLFPGLVARLAPVSPRVLEALSAQLLDRHADSADSLTLSAAAAQLGSVLLYRLLIALVLLLLLPLLASLSDPRRADLQSVPRQTNWFREVLFWMTSLIVAATLSWLLHGFYPQQVSWIAGFILLMPGCYGWIRFLWRTLVPQRELEGLERTSRMVLPALLLLPALLAATLLQLHGFSLSGPLVWLMPALIVLCTGMGPLGLTADQLTQQTGLRQDPSRLLWFVTWLVLPLGILVAFGSGSALTAVLMVFLAFWSERCGLALARISRSRLWGSLAQAVCHVWLILPLALSL